jgi:hypothetical protein
VGRFGLGNRTFDSYMIDLSIIVSLLPFGVKSVLEPLVIMRIVPWVGKVSVCYRGSRTCGGGGLVSGLFCWLVLLDVG